MENQPIQPIQENLKDDGVREDSHPYIYSEPIPVVPVIQESQHVEIISTNVTNEPVTSSIERELPHRLNEPVRNIALHIQRERIKKRMFRKVNGNWVFQRKKIGFKIAIMFSCVSILLFLCFLFSFGIRYHYNNDGEFVDMHVQDSGWVFIVILIIDFLVLVVLIICVTCSFKLEFDKKNQMLRGRTKRWCIRQKVWSTKEEEEEEEANKRIKRRRRNLNFDIEFHKIYDFCVWRKSVVCVLKKKEGGMGKDFIITSFISFEAANETCRRFKSILLESMGEENDV